MNKKLKKGIIIGVVVLIVIIIAILLLTQIKIVKPYVIENDIEISSATKKYKQPVYLYAEDKDFNYMPDTDIVFTDAKITYTFYDLKVNKKKTKDIYTFNYKMELPIEYYSHYNGGRWYYSFSSVDPIYFDYYTGDEYKVARISSNNNVKGLEFNDGKNMKYTTVKWKNKEYKIGLRIEYNLTWDGKKYLRDENGEKYYGDTGIEINKVTLEVPKDYDGALIAILKRGSTKESYEKNKELQEKYNSLKKEKEENGKSSEEFKKLNKQLNKKYKLFDSYLKENYYNKDDFIVFRVQDIKKISTKNNK